MTNLSNPPQIFHVLRIFTEESAAGMKLSRTEILKSLMFTVHNSYNIWTDASDDFMYLQSLSKFFYNMVNLSLKYNKF